MNDFKIEKDIKCPEPRTRNLKYPFDDMKCGDSFAFNSDIYVRVSATASYYSKKDNMKFSIRKDGDGYRCWRVK